MALDTAGNIYVGTESPRGVRESGWRKEVCPGGGSPILNATSGATDVAGIALDASGNIHFANWQANNVKLVDASGSGPKRGPERRPIGGNSPTK